MSTQMVPKSIGIVFPTSVDPHAWSREYDASRVPDMWPYGLHRLSSSPTESVALQAHSLGLQDKATLACSLIRTRKARAFGGSLEVGVAWDEYTAAKMVAQHPAQAMFSGVIWATDAWLSGNQIVRGRITKRLLMGLAGLWCLSRPQVEELQRQLKGRTPVDFLPFGIDHNFFQYTDQPEGMRILSLGVDRDRDPETLFAALDIVHRAVPQAEILVQTNSRRALPAGVTRFDRIPHAALRDLYRTANVVLIPTKPNLHASGMTVALEAGATGRPVVACRTPGMDDYVLHGRTGMLVRPGDSAAMASATLEILLDRGLASRLGMDARRHVERAHTSELMVLKLGEIIAKGI